MAARPNSIGTSKSGDITRSERLSANQQVEKMLKDVKAKAGEVILVQITDRTSIELPANLTLEEREARVEKYIRLHKSNV